ncbi:MAG TPA: metallophosphoesterase family protein [Solirubrobacterales bacterium]|nr:metallophosphoesterase family protein [Solirubrobacterales bacterium]
MIAIVADTHIPKGRRRLPERCIEVLSCAESVIHAGDLTSVSVLDELRSICPTLHAVHGNVDELALQRSLPATIEVELCGRTIAVTHDAGSARGRLTRMRSRFPDADAVVFGHSHLPLHEEDGGFQIFNPGSPTERRQAPRCSMGLLSCEHGQLVFQHVWL